MLEKISRIVFWGLSIALIVLGISEITKKLLIEGILVIAYGIMINPYVLERIARKIGGQVMDFSYLFRMLFLGTGFFVAYGIANVIFLQLSTEDTTLENYEAIFRILVYIIYLIVLFMFKNHDKTQKYVIFGIFYSGCVILSFSSEMINSMIIDMLNLVPQGNIDVESFQILVNDFFVPVKESILTYIIFDVIIEVKSVDCNHNEDVSF
ncbi:MAG: hypothetical protein J6I97_06485 [Agathobacter sp.]|nr:hypothetical protein [Agathobacter sp.]